jgi:N2-acetyl-L-2,4-diaminobutanoate deacetylase
MSLSRPIMNGARRAEDLEVRRSLCESKNEHPEQAKELENDPIIVADASCSEKCMADVPWTYTPVAGIDLDSPGKRLYLVNITYQLTGKLGELAWPLAVVKNGQGPVVLVAGGTHGDEFEGQAAAVRLIKRLDLAAVTGTLFVVPQLNQPARAVSARCSPLDGANINRLYGLKGTEGPSQAIADFVLSELVRRADIVIDIHSGGEALEFVLSSNLQATVGTPELARNLPALMAFNAPYAIVFDEVDPASAMPHQGTLESAARDQGKIAISSEVGGSGRVSPASMRVADHGLRNVLNHFGVAKDSAACSPERSTSTLLRLYRSENYVESPYAGLFVPSVWLGDQVRQGATLAEIYGSAEEGFAARRIVSEVEGTVVALARRGVVQPGESVMFIAERLQW